MKNVILATVAIIVSIRVMSGIVVKEIDFHQHDALTTPWTQSIDLNNDGKIDVTFTSIPWFRNLIMTDSSTLTTGILIPDETPKFLLEGDSIGSSLEYLSSGFLLVANDSAKMPINETVYLGYKIFNVSTQTWHYGWLSIKMDWFHEIFYVYESGYNDAEEMPLTAGQKSLSIMEPMPDSIKIFSSGNELVIEGLPLDFNGEIRVYDIAGRILWETMAAGPGVRLRGNFLHGPVVITLSSSRYHYSEKVFL